MNRFGSASWLSIKWQPIESDRDNPMIYNQAAGRVGDLVAVSSDESTDSLVFHFDTRLDEQRVQEFVRFIVRHGYQWDASFLNWENI